MAQRSISATASRPSRHLKKGLVDRFNVVRPTDAYATPALAAVPATVPMVFSIGGEEARDGFDRISKWAKETNPDLGWLYQTRLTMRNWLRWSGTTMLPESHGVT